MTGQLVVVGDTLLDRDVDGTATRLCPEAPAPVLDEEHVAERPGGAGLAASWASRQGMAVTLVTALASDAGGARLSGLLSASGVAVLALPLAGVTPEKTRLRAGGHTLLRWDRGDRGGAATGQPGEAALAAIRDAAVVLVSDYGWGTARQPALREALAATRAPVVWDPHPHGAAAVAGVRLATPNESEVCALAGGASGDRMVALSRGAQQLRHRWRAEAVAVTLGEAGALLYRAGPAPQLVPAPGHATGDTCGAGDVFAAAAAAALAAGARVAEAVESAVARASGYVRDGGVRQLLADAPAAAEPPPAAAPPVGSVGAGAAGELVARTRARGGRVVATGGCFDLLHAGHVATLQSARELGDCLVVCLNSDTSVAARKGPGRPVNDQYDRARVLAALGCVDAVVIFDEPTPEAVLSWLRPDVWVKGGDYAGAGAAASRLPEAELVRQWDGQVVLVPYLAGRSTTALLAAGGNGDHRRRPPRAVAGAE